MDHDGPLGSKGRHDDAAKTEAGLSGEMIGGIVIGILVVIALVLIFALFNRRRQSQKPVDPTATEDKPEKPTTTMTSTSAETAPPEEKEALLADVEKDVEKSLPDEADDVDLRPKFASPIWIDEIQVEVSKMSFFALNLRLNKLGCFTLVYYLALAQGPII
jgi:hypothetical protein